MTDTQPLAPTDAEIDALWVGQQLTVPQLVQRRVIACAALAKWGTPQPVAREPLSDAQIAEMMRDTWGCASIAPRHAMGFARAIEAEVRKQDEALIRQMLEALETAGVYPPSAQAAITAARARLGEKT